MRHLWSLLAGVVIAPLTWAVVAFGQTVTGEVVKAGPLTSFSSKLLLAGAAFVGAGIIVGLIGTLRVSPFGPLLVALLYLGSSALLVFAPKTALDVFDRVQKDLFGHDVLLLPPLTSGVIPVLGGALLLAVFSAGRWRAWPGADVVEPVTQPTTDSPWTATPVSPASTATEPVSPASSTTTTNTWTTPYSSPSTPAAGEGGTTSTGSDSGASPWGPPPNR
jgi:hypothetical protein